MIDPKIAERVGRLTLVVLVAAFAAFTSHKLIRPALAAGAQLEAFRKAVAILMDAEGSVDQLGAEIRSVAEKVAEYEALLPETLDLDLFLEELGNLAQRNQVHIEKLTPHKVKEHSLFRELEIEVRATGTYLAIYEFMHQLEHGKQLARARELRIASGTPGGKCAADIRLVLYFAPDGKE
jgi:Tfp pilus assembly protein PilO